VKSEVRIMMKGAHDRSWLSTARPVIEPAAAARPLGIRRAVISFSPVSHQALLQSFDLQTAEAGPSLPGALEGKLGDGVAIYQAYFGAPATGMLMEALVASGVRFVVQVGMAGSISPACRIGDLVVPTWGIREEGTSYHYLPPDVPGRVSEESLALLRRCLEGGRFLEGGVWTTDAPYRETEDKVQAYARQGVLAVEMECTALMAIAAVRQVAFAAALVITDELFGQEWVQGFASEPVQATSGWLCQALARGFREEFDPGPDRVPGHGG
jgi:uridine phosphorylase